jgi:xanthine dehydrogenase accessory factor
VAATVVRASRPTSVRPGDSALVLADGTIEGFVGGACAESSVRLHAARALETGEPVLLRITPGDDEAPAGEGAVSVRNPCLSGGALEVFLEPCLPAPMAVVAGDGPAALAMADLLRWMGWETRPATAGVADAEAVVVAAHGGAEEPILQAALEAGVPYVALVASRRRGAAIADALRAAGCDDVALGRLHTPAGLDIGARGPHEIAVSVVAEIVADRHAAPRLGGPAADDPARPSAPAADASAPSATASPPAGVTAAPAAVAAGVSATTAPAEAVDPVCGMTVLAGPVTPHLEHDGARVYFCGEGCLRAFAADHAASR